MSSIISSIVFSKSLLLECFTIFWKMSGESPRIGFPTLKERGEIVYPDLDFLWWEKGKEWKRHKNFTKRKVVFFFSFLFPLPSSNFLSGIFAGLFQTWQLCGYERLLMRGLGGHTAEIFPSRTWQCRFIRAVWGWCLCACELRYLFFRYSAMRNFFFLEQGRKPKPYHSWFCVLELYPFSEN